MPSQELLTLNSSAELMGVRCLEIAAKRFPVVSAEPAEDTRIAPELSLNIAPHDEENPQDLLFALRVHVEFDGGEATVAYQSRFQHGLEERPSMHTLTEYANEVAIMVLLPYLREALSDVTRRVFGNPLTMPLFQRGELQFNTNDVHG